VEIFSRAILLQIPINGISMGTRFQAQQINLNINQTGAYTVEITDSNGCSSSAV
jgi:hypothetical protein